MSGIRRLAPFAVVAFVACGQTSDADRTMPDTTTSDPQSPALAAVDSGLPRLLPVDQADSSFRVFREQALQALARRDTAFLYDIVSPDIRASLGSEEGLADFRRIWQMHEPAGSGIWDVLARVLSMGGALTDSTFIAPYVYAFWPDSIDAFEYAAVTSERALVYPEPRDGDRAIGTASYSIMRVVAWQQPDESRAVNTGWVRVALPGVEPAWIRASDVYSPIGWRVYFERRDGRWTLTVFVAGD